MGKSLVDVYAEHLDELRSEWLSSNEAKDVLSGSKISTRSSCRIGGKTWQQAIYSDFSGDRIFVVFELRREKIFFGTTHVLGLEILNGSFINLTAEEIWKEGIP